MNRFFKKTAILCTLGAVFLCTACNFAESGIDDLMRPPQLSESRQQIQATVSELSGGTYHLVSPHSGDNRTGIEIYDLDGDKRDEAVCLFTTPAAPNVTLLVLRKDGAKWTEQGRYASDATGVDKIEFADLDGDGNCEIVVGWSYLTGGDGVLEILSPADSFRSVHKELYGQFVMAGRQNNKIVLINPSAASATLLGCHDGDYHSLASVPIDSNISSITGITVSQTTAGDSAVYMDVQTENQSYHTEVLVIKSDEFLENKLLDGTETERALAVRTTDIDRNGVPEIPCTKPMKQQEGYASYTYWYNFTGDALTEPIVTFTSTMEQFYLVYPAAWVGKLFVRRDEIHQRLYYFENKAGEVIYSLRVFSPSEFDAEDGSQWHRIFDGNGSVFAYKIDGDTAEFPTELWEKSLHIY